ncbi:MAG: chemotaxis response regulator protein-glutamate methylesterase [Actinobacteria bacterium HGW-Actinobacteria-10]|nr:MAG: chemotaxis response regulator protein-glutamate methylesterase [Actinobacteria bacterium HGW-Actinobacteria-10]
MIDTPGQIRVLIADDSLVAREMLAQILATDPRIEVVGMAHDGREAVDMVANLKPDLVTMDIHMPRMDGLVAIEQIMAYHPTPILVVSSSVHGEGMGRAFDALRIGALDVIKKPEARDWAELDRIGREVIKRVKILSRIRVITHIAGKRGQGTRDRIAVEPVHHARQGVRSIVAIGSSTGGPSALLNVLGRLPKDFSVPIVIAQHIADGFIPGLVNWLDAGCQIRIQEAVENQAALPGNAYLAPTGSNLEMDGYTMHFSKPHLGQLYIPSADSLFMSVASTFGRNAVGVILTGMGADGAIGLKRMREVGAATLGQDEATCAVYGMPKAAAELNALDSELSVLDIAAEVERLVAGG